MAKFKNDPFPGTDYTRYLEWKKVVTPDGQTYYEVPGHPGYVFDPVASSATGDKVFRQNPQREITKQEEAERTQADLIKQDKFNKSPVGQLLPVAGSTAGLIAAHQFMQPGPDPISQAIAAKISGTGAASAVNPAASAAAGAAGLPASSGIPYYLAENVPGVEAGFDILGSSGGAAPVAEAGIGYMPYVGALGAGLGAYGVYDAIQNNDVGGGALSGAGLGLGLGAAAPLVGLGPVGWAGLAGMAALGALGGGGLASVFGHESTRDVAKRHTGDLMDQAKGDAAAEAYVAGIREQHNYAPPDPDKPFLNGTYGSFDEYKKAGLQANDLTGVYGNMKTYGAKEWANLTEDQRLKITQANINSGLYDSKKGEVIINDAASAKKNYDDVLAGIVQPVPTSAPAQAAAIGATKLPQPLARPIMLPQAQISGGAMGSPLPLPSGIVAPLQPAQIAAQAAATGAMRSNTSSPGIGLDGSPIKAAQNSIPGIRKVNSGFGR